MKRARPLLGTFVEITADAHDAQRALTRAFAAIEALQAILNVHDEESELALVNRCAALRPVPVGRDLYRVLCAALRLARLSGGAFDPTTGSAGASFRDVELLAGRCVRFRRALRLDLGGIAKGYCVDRAVRELKHAGVESGVVNAGGDLRVFGTRGVALHLRHPADPAQLMPLGELREAALATSASYASGGERCAGRPPIPPGLSISVRARRAVLADALTKVVAALGAGAEPLLARHRARAWIVGPAA